VHRNINHYLEELIQFCSPIEKELLILIYNFVITIGVLSKLLLCLFCQQLVFSIQIDHKVNNRVISFLQGGAVFSIRLFLSSFAAAVGCSAMIAWIHIFFFIVLPFIYI
jgi:hypothetical protein